MKSRLGLRDIRAIHECRVDSMPACEEAISAFPWSTFFIILSR